MISIQAVITGILAVALILYFAGYIPIKSYLEHRQNKNDGVVLKECGYCAQQHATWRCTGCKNIFYCSVKCQASHWKSGHKKVCQSTNTKSSAKKTKKKKKSQKKEDFMKMLSSFSELTGGNDDEDDEKNAVFDE
eukprot:160765_1